MAIQALLKFRNGTEAVSHVYARIPDTSISLGEPLSTTVSTPLPNQRDMAKLNSLLTLSNGNEGNAIPFSIDVHPKDTPLPFSDHKQSLELIRISEYLKVSSIRDGYDFYYCFCHLSADLAVGAAFNKIVTYVSQIFDISTKGNPGSSVVREAALALCSQLRIARLAKIETSLSKEGVYYLTDLGADLALYAQIAGAGTKVLPRE